MTEISRHGEFADELAADLAENLSKQLAEKLILDSQLPSGRSALRSVTRVRFQPNIL